MITDEMVERAAQAVFEHWQFQDYRNNVGTPATVSWTPNGNSLKQDQAHVTRGSFIKADVFGMLVRPRMTTMTHMKTKKPRLMPGLLKSLET